MPELLSAGQPSYWHGPTAILPQYRSMNIVQRLGHRTLTVGGLEVTVHHHFGYRIHFEFRGEFGSRSFERWFRSFAACERSCADIVQGYPEGLCECMLMREWITMYSTLEYGGRYEPLCAGGRLSGPLWKGLFIWTPRRILSLDEKRLRPYMAAGKRICRGETAARGVAASSHPPRVHDSSRSINKAGYAFRATRVLSSYWHAIRHICSFFPVCRLLHAYFSPHLSLSVSLHCPSIPRTCSYLSALRHGDVSRSDWSFPSYYSPLVTYTYHSALRSPLQICDGRRSVRT